MRKFGGFGTAPRKFGGFGTALRKFGGFGIAPRTFGGFGTALRKFSGFGIALRKFGGLGSQFSDEFGGLETIRWFGKAEFDGLVRRSLDFRRFQYFIKILC